MRTVRAILLASVGIGAFPMYEPLGNMRTMMKRKTKKRKIAVVEERDTIKALRQRINRVIGQAKAVKRLVNERATCEKTLYYVIASKNAIHQLGYTMLQAHVLEEVEGIAKGETPKALLDRIHPLLAFLEEGNGVVQPPAEGKRTIHQAMDAMIVRCERISEMVSKAAPLVEILEETARAKQEVHQAGLIIYEDFLRRCLEKPETALSAHHLGQYARGLDLLNRIAR